MLKVFSINHQIGHVKRSVKFHDGKKTHKDGSPFFDLRIFKNMKALNAFVKDLKSDGYVVNTSLPLLHALR